MSLKLSCNRIKVIDSSVIFNHVPNVHKILSIISSLKTLSPIPLFLGFKQRICRFESSNGVISVIITIMCAVY